MYLIAYDITDGGRLRAVAKVLNRYGYRVQKSVFECDISKQQYNKLKAKLSAIKSGNDKIKCYSLRNDTRTEDF